jgi:hypothetical protein
MLSSKRRPPAGANCLRMLQMFFVYYTTPLYRESDMASSRDPNYLNKKADLVLALRMGPQYDFGYPKHCLISETTSCQFIVAENAR